MAATKSEAGLHTFVLSVSEWLEKTNAKGMYVKEVAMESRYIRLCVRKSDFHKNELTCVNKNAIICVIKNAKKGSCL